MSYLFSFHLINVAKDFFVLIAIVATYIISYIYITFLLSPLNHSISKTIHYGFFENWIDCKIAIFKIKNRKRQS